MKITDVRVLPGDSGFLIDRIEEIKMDNLEEEIHELLMDKEYENKDRII